MEFGVSTWLWTSPLTTEKLEKLVAHAADMGFDLIEVPIEDPTLVDYPHAAQVIRDHGLSVSVCAAMGGDRDLIHPDEDVRTRAAGYVQECIDIAHEVGSDRVGGPLYSAVGRCWRATPEEREADIELLVQQLRPLATYAEERDVTLCVEPLNRFETSFLNLTEQVVDVVDRVDHPACQILLDTFHLGIEEKDLGAAIRLAGDRLRHLQVSDNDRGVPGTGHLPWAEVAEALEDIGYDDPVVIESFTDENESMAKAASIWRPLAPDQDTFARDGLHFLRDLLA